jgi:hypothetical protein
MSAAKHAVYWTEATMNPRAECQNCTWNLGYGKQATAAVCKAHVAATGHTVRRVKETIGVYYPR